LGKMIVREKGVELIKYSLNILIASLFTLCGIGVDLIRWENWEGCS
jgi:hypothetical protein